jgi:2-polyprenyl-6-hydroxyphenyl methylase/3-demethylubiquinone-9 3-methyltransferase
MNQRKAALDKAVQRIRHMEEQASWLERATRADRAGKEQDGGRGAYTDGDSSGNLTGNSAKGKGDDVKQ